LHRREQCIRRYPVCCQRKRSIHILHIDHTGSIPNAHGPQVTSIAHEFHTRGRPSRKKRQQFCPPVRSPVGKLDSEGRRRKFSIPTATKLSRRSAICFSKRVIEAPHTAKAGRNRNILHRQRRLVDKPFRELQALSMCNGKRTGAHVPGKKASQVAAGYAQPVRKALDITVLKRPIGY
jgi:hypothetical protein